MVFKCEKIEKIYFYVEADDEEQAQEFIQTHGISEIVDMIPDKCIDSEDSEQVLFPVDGYADIDIRSKEIGTMDKYTFSFVDCNGDTFSGYEIQAATYEKAKEKAIERYSKYHKGYRSMNVMSVWRNGIDIAQAYINDLIQRTTN